MALGVAITAASYVAQTLAWRSLMAGLGCRTRLITAFRAWGYAQLAKYTPAKLAVVMTRIHVCDGEGIRPSKVVAGTVLEILLSLVCTLGLWLVSTVAQPGRGGVQRILALAALVVMLAALHPQVIAAVLRRYYRWRKVPEEAPRVTFAAMLRAGAMYLLGWALFGLGGWFMYAAVPATLPASPTSVLQVSGAFTLAWAVGYIVIILPGGIGAREGALVWALTSQASLACAVTVAVLSRLCQGGVDVGAAAIPWICARIERSKTKRAES